MFHVEHSVIPPIGGLDPLCWLKLQVERMRRPAAAEAAMGGLFSVERPLPAARVASR